MTVTLQLPPATTPVLDRNGYMTQPWRTFFIDLVTRAGGITGGLQPADATLDSLAALDASPGVLVEAGPDVFTKRTIAGTAGRVTVANGTGAAGNPTIDLADSGVAAGTYVFGTKNVTVDAKGRITAIA